MKKYHFTVLIVFCSYFFTFAESGVTGQDFKYRRSSLHKVLIQSESFPKKDVVMNAWESCPFPDKYNNHSVSSVF